MIEFRFYNHDAKEDCCQQMPAAVLTYQNKNFNPLTWKIDILQDGSPHFKACSAYVVGKFTSSSIMHHS